MLDQQVAALNFLNLHAHIGGYQAEFLRHFAASAGSMSTSMIPNNPTSQPQKSSAAVRPSNSSFVGNKGISGLPNPQSAQKSSSSSSSPLASISITPLPPVTCSTNTSTKYSNSESSKSAPSLQQKLQASQALAKSASNQPFVLNLSSSVSKACSQVSTSVAHLPLTVTTSSYTAPKEQALFTPQPQKSSPNPYISLLKGGEGMLTAGVSISQVTSTPVNTITSPKSSTSKLMSFRKHSISSSQGNQNQDQSNMSKDAVNIASFKDSYSDSSKMPGSSVCGSDCSPVTKSRDITSKTSATLGSRNQSSGCKLPSSSSKNGKTHMLAMSRSHSSGIAQESSVYKETQITPKSSNPFVQRGQISESTLIKNKSAQSKELNSSSIYKSQSGTKGSRSPAPLRSIGHEITVMPSLPQSTSTTVSSISTVGHFHQQCTELEIMTKTKPASLDLPVTIPSSITITPKQQGTPETRGQQGKQSPVGGDSFRCSTKKYKDSVSITEVGRKIPAGSQGVKRIGGSSAIRQDRQLEERQDNKHGGGGDVEVITLE
jgi:hypothetical protein